MSAKLIPLKRALAALPRHARGVAAIEMAMTLPVLAMLSIGAFDVGRMVLQRLDYQQAAAEVTTLAIAKPPSTDTTYLKTAAASASGLDASKITAALSLTCDGAASNDACAAGQEQARYMTLTLNGQYVPLWTHFGVDQTVNMTVARTVRYQ